MTNQYPFIQFILLSLIAATIYMACNNDSAPATSQSATSEPPLNLEGLDPAALNKAAFKSLLHQTPEAILLDVRTPQEFDQGHIEGAINRDYHAQEFEAQMDAINPKYSLFIYCQSGGRSGKTYHMLKQKGFEKVYNLDGGYLAWKDSLQ